MDIFVVAFFVGVSGTALVYLLQLVLQKIANNYHDTYEHRMQQSLTELFLFVPVRQLLIAWLIILILLFVSLLLLATPWIWLLCIMLVMAVGPWRFYQFLKNRRQANFQRQLPDALLLLANILRAGGSVQVGLQFLAREMPIPLAQEMTLVTRQLRLGKSFAAALCDLQQRMPSTELDRTVVALKLGYETGGQQAPLLERLAASMRKKLQLQQRILSLSAQGRIQGRVMTALPLLLCAVLWGMEREVMQQLSTQYLGWALAMIMLCMLAAGHWLINRMLKIEVPL
ncbi:Flp pilus assembly protein TadB [Idiomarina sp. A28L]|uniref:type II secretion system F family protein n=1 Tax=Idiomarina sp. A28L TaxID=1036674 RepID=UPI00021387C2|nr:type II secretion system F family protein [Idiomarina sp. A28L]EGN76433.1 Flp pilus assembly protein TadB [Idiomarina sp. A28L]